jgi:transcriptional regulator with XRE-family HTH domain
MTGSAPLHVRQKGEAVQIDRGPQPAKWLVIRRGIEIRHVAKRIGFSPYYVGQVLDGKVTASPRFRSHLSAFLDVDEEALFDYALGDDLVAS